jgi:CHAT domain-containing protein
VKSYKVNLRLTLNVQGGIKEGHIWWCLTGAFVGLPLHAASITNTFVHSYTATLGALIEGNSKIQLKSDSSLPCVGAVGVTHNSSYGDGVLPGVKQEIEVITSIIGKENVSNLVGEQATVEAVKNQLQCYSWVHLACHGKQDLLDPPQSCLQLYEGSLELHTILQMSLSDAEFVYLAACQTAMGDNQMINESFHLSGGFIAAGFQGAIGTMWSMRDADGPTVANSVYSYIFHHSKRPQASDAGKALQLAVQKLRDDGIPYERCVPFIHIGI